MYFSWASDLDPKGVNSQVKEAIMGPGQGDDECPVTQSGKQILCLNAFQHSHIRLKFKFEVINKVHKKTIYFSTLRFLEIV